MVLGAVSAFSEQPALPMRAAVEPASIVTTDPQSLASGSSEAPEFQTQFIGGLVGAIGGAIGDGLSFIGEGIGDIAIDVIGNIGDVVGDVLGDIGNIIGDIAVEIIDVGGDIAVDLIGIGLDIAGDILGEIGEDLLAALGPVAEFLLETGAGLLGGLVEVVGGALAGLLAPGAEADEFDITPEIEADLRAAIDQFAEVVGQIGPQRMQIADTRSKLLAASQQQLTPEQRAQVEAGLERINPIIDVFDEVLLTSGAVVQLGEEMLDRHASIGVSVLDSWKSTVDVAGLSLKSLQAVTGQATPEGETTEQTESAPAPVVGMATPSEGYESTFPALSDITTQGSIELLAPSVFLVVEEIQGREARVPSALGRNDDLRSMLAATRQFVEGIGALGATVNLNIYNAFIALAQGVYDTAAKTDIAPATFGPETVAPAIIEPEALAAETTT